MSTIGGRMKMLFSDAPPDALEKLLSPRRTFIYGLFAFGPGTVLGLYLYSVKRRMERENESLRLEQVEGELGVVKEQQSKDQALASAIQEMRDRLRRLEEEAEASRQNAAKVATATSSSADKGKTKTPAAAGGKIEAALAILTAKEQPDAQKASASPTWLTSSLDGTQGRRDKRHQEMLQQDVAAHVAKQKDSK
ncbi:hypothetical protein PF005_g5134 [Phytophthora fragariae]|uniref:Peroxin-14 n=2 Tax=Phytophthora TaxID=4783 RepID=A0A6A3YY21_9STRA|nr:hypothetical protein PF003_g9671 [Phytophthora fragariae]KAE9037455.1 hypothetical protein PR002_g6571 [Phytophthora rubi]KAE8940962.1 hypothetical protein PF009_g9254 [Phytophthora fragariae]KAE9021866.1 hypothetical protein PF011_g4746 [Phytophthora fragariae]KAE9042499.1 hypothetical protein PR001_g6171 [Phytophthora rubi]